MKHDINIRQGALIALTLVLMPAATLAQAKPSTLPSVAASARATAAGGLAAAKLTVCQNKEAAITKRSTQLVRMATNMLETFDAIATRVEKYYTTIVVPAGRTVSSYDTLVTEISTKKTAVQTALTKAEASAVAFSCTSDNPKGQLTQFRTDMQTVKSALQEYRTAIKNLIVAVRSITGKTESSLNPKASISPKTSVTPTTSVTPSLSTAPEAQ